MLYPVRVCKPAPTVERRAPIRIIHLVGKASNDTVKSPVLSPNLQGREERTCLTKGHSHSP